MSVIIRTFLIALLFAAIIFILGANNIFSIKDAVVDFSIEAVSYTHLTLPTKRIV